MTWVRLDEEFYHHPKVVQVGPLGMAMQVAALCYSNRYLTDGFISRKIAPGLIDLDGVLFRDEDTEIANGWHAPLWPMVVEALVEAGLWEPVKGGWKIHDYEDYQPSKAEVEVQRERNRVAGQKGGLKRAAKQNGKQPASEVLSEVSSETQAECQAKAQAKSKPVPVSVPVSVSDSVSDSVFVSGSRVENPRFKDFASQLSETNPNLKAVSELVAGAVRAIDARSAVLREATA